MISKIVCLFRSSGAAQNCEEQNEHRGYFYCKSRIELVWPKREVKTIFKLVISFEIANAKKFN